MYVFHNWHNSQHGRKTALKPKNLEILKYRYRFSFPFQIWLSWVHFQSRNRQDGWRHDSKPLPRYLWGQRARNSSARPGSRPTSSKMPSFLLGLTTLGPLSRMRGRLHLCLKNPIATEKLLHLPTSRKDCCLSAKKNPQFCVGEGIRYERWPRGRGDYLLCCPNKRR